MNKKNIRYYAFSILDFILLHIPIITIYFNQIIKSVTLVSVLFLAKSVTVSLLEVPTGYISDRCSRKLSLCLSIMFNIASLALFMAGTNFYLLLAGEICFGISECLMSGSDAAFFYDNFAYEKRIDDYNSYVKNITLVQSIFLSVAFFAGSIIYGINYKLVFAITIFFQIIALLVLISIKEHPYKKKIQVKERSESQLKNFLKFMNKKIVCMIILYASILAMFLSIYLQLFPLVTEKVTNNFYLYGITYTIVMLAYGFGAKNGSKDLNRIPVVLLVLMVSMIAGVFVNNDFYVLIIILLSRFIWGYISTGINIYLNEIITDSNFRATTFSVLSILTGIISAVFMFFIGFIMDRNLGLKYIFLVWIFVLAILLVMYRLFIRGRK